MREQIEIMMRESEGEEEVEEKDVDPFDIEIEERSDCCTIMNRDSNLKPNNQIRNQVFSQQVLPSFKRIEPLKTQNLGRNSVLPTHSIPPTYHIPTKSDIEKMREYLTNDCGIKCKDLSQTNIVRVYNEMLEY
jgi:hypothetical protein